MRKGAAQREFNNMPERTPLGKKAIEYLNIKDEIDNCRIELDKIKPELVQEFIKANKKSIKVETYVVYYSHCESDTITARQEG